jgi:hypothetical protein
MAATRQLKHSANSRNVAAAPTAKHGRRSSRTPNFSEDLGASRSFAVTNRPHGPFGVAALLDEINNRLVSRGGRPSDPGPTIRRLVPLKKQVWSSLKAQADFLSRRGKRVSPAQLAAMLVEKSISGLKTDQDTEAK